MQKIAQERSFLTKIKENLNLKGINLERDSDFKSLMIKLRQTDDSYRSVMSGKQIISNESGTLLEAAFPLSNVSLKELVKNIKKYYKEKDFLNFNENLKKFNDQVTQAKNCLEYFSYDISLFEKQLLSKNIEANVKYYFLKSQNTITLFNKQQLIKNSIFESESQKKFQDLLKKFPKKFNKLNLEMKSIVDKSQRLLDAMINSADKFSTFRAYRQAEPYSLECKKIISQINSFNNSFDKFYSSNLEQILSKEDESFLERKIKETEETQAETTKPIISDQFSQPSMPKMVENIPIPSAQTNQPVIIQEDLEDLQQKILKGILDKKSEIINELKNDLIITDDRLLQLINPIINGALSGSAKQVNESIERIKDKLKEHESKLINAKILENIVESKLNQVIVPGLEQFIVSKLSEQIGSDKIDAIKTSILKSLEQIINNKINELSIQAPVAPLISAPAPATSVPPAVPVSATPAPAATVEPASPTKEIKTSNVNNKLQEKIEEITGIDLGENRIILLANIIKKHFSKNETKCIEFIDSEKFKLILEQKNEDKSYKECIEEALKA